MVISGVIRILKCILFFTPTLTLPRILYNWYDVKIKQIFKIIFCCNVTKYRIIGQLYINIKQTKEKRDQIHTQEVRLKGELMKVVKRYKFLACIKY